MYFLPRLNFMALLSALILIACPIEVMAQEAAGMDERIVSGQALIADKDINGRLVLGRRGAVVFAHESPEPFKCQTLTLAGPEAAVSFGALVFQKIEIGLLEAESSAVFTFKVDYTKGQADHLTILESIDQDPEQTVAIQPLAANVDQADNIPLILDKSKKLVFSLQASETVKLGDEHYQLTPELTDEGVVWSLKYR